MGEYVEFVTVHYPHLLDYVNLIAHEDEYTGAESIGSGVMIASGGHHFIATAAHCIMRNSRVMCYQNFYITTNDKIATSPPVKVIQSWSHPTLEIGFLEIGEALGAEMNEEQLYSSPSVKGYLHIVGHPTCRNEVNERLKEIALVKSVFG